MKLLIKILFLLCGLMLSSAYAGTTPNDTKSTAKSAAAENLDRDSVCTRCHDENESKPILAIYQTAHGNKADSRTPSCQACHGESEKHLSSKSAAPDVIFGKNSVSGHAPTEAKDQNKTCLSCHDKDQKRTHWEGSVHQVADVACTSCHEVHAAHDNVRDKKTQPDVCFACHKEQRSQIRKFSHHPIGEAKVACSDCHNPHGSAGPKLLNKNTVTETCYTCHAEKRGPFLWEHQPVTEDCTNCHTPHGSNITPLLKSRPPFMCDECHDGPHQSKSPAAGNAAGIQGGLTGNPANPSSTVTGRACMNCHSMVHGSNDPAGALLQR
jgi:DmsE family decaheme c-type cytochrome